MNAVILPAGLPGEGGSVTGQVGLAVAQQHFESLGPVPGIVHWQRSVHFGVGDHGHGQLIFEDVEVLPVVITDASDILGFDDVLLHVGTFFIVHENQAVRSQDAYRGGVLALSLSPYL